MANAFITSIRGNLDRAGITLSALCVVHCLATLVLVGTLGLGGELLADPIIHEVGLALATSPTLLLLDEPLAGMSAEERVETVALLKSIAKGRTLVIIDHDMDSLFELVERVTVLQEGRLLVEGTPDEIKNNAQVQEAYLGGVHGETQ